MREDLVQPVPALRFSATRRNSGSRPPVVGEHADAVLADLGVSGDELRRCVRLGSWIGGFPCTMKKSR
jgi:crotonobetainyl-CoA:carnitine CoA-transferase CaiB-like acyl-CoA transferase